MKAVFINAEARTVEEIEIENDLDALYKKIDCGIVQGIHTGGTETEYLLCDEEACFKDLCFGFIFKRVNSTFILGNALIVDSDRGDFADVRRTADEIREEIFFKRREA